MALDVALIPNGLNRKDFPNGTANPGFPYIALSYVCDRDWLKSTLENVDILQKPGELVSGRHVDLPKTVYDAVNLLSILGERYL